MEHHDLCGYVNCFSTYLVYLYESTSKDYKKSQLGTLLCIGLVVGNDRLVYLLNMQCSMYMIEERNYRIVVGRFNALIGLVTDN